MFTQPDNDVDELRQDNITPSSSKDEDTRVDSTEKVDSAAADRDTEANIQTPLSNKKLKGCSCKAAINNLFLFFAYLSTYIFPVRRKRPKERWETVFNGFIINLIVFVLYVTMLAGLSVSGKEYEIYCRKRGIRVLLLMISIPIAAPLPYWWVAYVVSGSKPLVV